MSYHRFGPDSCEDCMGTGGQRDCDGEGTCSACGGSGKLYYGSFEVFEVTAAAGPAHVINDGRPEAAGFYWWPCFPGCMPDGEASGPFATYAEAVTDAREG